MVRRDCRECLLDAVWICSLQPTEVSNRSSLAKLCLVVIGPGESLAHWWKIHEPEVRDQYVESPHVSVPSFAAVTFVVASGSFEVPA